MLARLRKPTKNPFHQPWRVMMLIVIAPISGLAAAGLMYLADPVCAVNPCTDDGRQIVVVDS